MNWIRLYHRLNNNDHLHLQLRPLQRSAFTCFACEGVFVDWDSRHQGSVYRGWENEKAILGGIG